MCKSLVYESLFEFSIDDANVPILNQTLRTYIHHKYTECECHDKELYQIG